MSPSHYLAILVYLQLSTAIIGHENLNGSCVQFDKSKLADVLHLIREPAINTVEIILTVASANKTRVFPEMKWPWTNEIGRTLISLTSRAEASVFSSTIFTSFLKAGMERVSIEVTEKIIGCLPPGKNGSDRVFSDLLEKLFLHTEEEEKDNYYKLCRPHDIEGPVQFNCCRITGDSKLTICADYSSIVLKWAFPVIIMAIAVFSVMMLPSLLEHTTYPKTKIYKTSDSHMSLISIVSMIFFEGDSLAKIFFRRFVFVVFTSIVFYLADFLNCNYLFFLILFVIWAFLFCSLKFLEKMLQQDTAEKPEFEKNLVSCFTIPLSLPVDYYCLDRPNDSSNKCCVWFVTFLLSFTPIILVPFLLVKFILFDYMLRFVYPYTCEDCNCTWKSFWKTLVYIFAVSTRFLSLLVFVIFTGSILLFVLSLTVGLILNGEFDPLFSPIVTLAVFFWKNWQFSVEAQCLQLKTLIIEVCKEKAEMDDAVESETYSEKKEQSKSCCVRKCACCSDSCDLLLEFLSSCDRHLYPSGNRCCCCSDDPGDNNNSQENGGNVVYNVAEQTLTIEFDKNDGEAMISKKLYQEVSKQIMPLGELLFRFFRRILFVAIYAGIMFIVLILGKESGVSGSLQAISAIVAILIPFIFDTIYADHHLAQKISKNMATKEKLEHIIWRVKKQKKYLLVVQLKSQYKPMKELLKQPWHTIEQSLQTIQSSWPTIEQSWERIEQSWETIEQSWETIKQSWQTIEQSWLTIEQSWKTVKRSSEKIKPLLENIKTLLREKIEQARERNGQSPQNEDLKAIEREKLPKIDQLWPEIEELLGENVDELWHRVERSWQIIEKSLQKKIERSWEKIELRPAVQQSWETNERSWRTLEKLPSTKPSWETITTSCNEIGQLFKRIETLRTTIESSSQEMKMSWLEINQSLKRYHDKCDELNRDNGMEMENM